MLSATSLAFDQIALENITISFVIVIFHPSIQGRFNRQVLDVCWVRAEQCEYAAWPIMQTQHSKSRDTAGSLWVTPLNEAMIRCISTRKSWRIDRLTTKV
jgi:hypothetical protein